MRGLLLRYPARRPLTLRTAEPLTAGSPHRCTRPATASIGDAAVFIAIDRWARPPRSSCSSAETSPPRPVA